MSPSDGPVRGNRECDGRARPGSKARGPSCRCSSWPGPAASAPRRGAGPASLPQVPFQAGNPRTLKPTSSQLAFCLPRKALSASFHSSVFVPGRVRSLTSWFPKHPYHPWCGLAGVVTAESILWSQDVHVRSPRYQTSLMRCVVGRGRHHLGDPGPRWGCLLTLLHGAPGPLATGCLPSPAALTLGFGL